MPEPEVTPAVPAPAAIPAPAASAPTKQVLRVDESEVFESPEKLVEAKRHANEHIKKLESELAQLRAQGETLNKLKTVFSPEPADNGFDQATYFEKLNRSAVEANEYALSFSPKFKQFEQWQQSTQLQQVGVAFMAKNPGFQATPDNVNLLTERMGLLGEGGDLNAKMEAAYHSLVAEGKIKPAAPAATATPSGPQPPPHLQGVSVPNSPADAELARKIQMARTKEERNQILREAGRPPL